MANKIKEWRGCRGLVFAEILFDDNTEEGGYKTGEVMELAGLAEVSKSVEVERASKYYDNIQAMVTTAEGEDTVTFTASVPTDKVLASVNGRVWDDELKMYIECPIVSKFYAVGYIIGDTNDDEYYVWRHKGYFLSPEETSATKDDGTDGNGMSLEFHGVYTQHVFENGAGKGKPSHIKSFRMNPKDKDLSTFFDTVTSPDTVFPDIAEG